MILPATNLAVLLLVGLSLVCWGSWANLQKLAGKWRFELFYYDYALGVAVCAVLAAFTLGSLSSQELTFQENFLVTGYRKMAFAVAAGIIFNLANILLAAAISVSGLAVAFPITMGLALIIGSAWNFATSPQENGMLLAVGVVLLVAAVTIQSFAYRSLLFARQEAEKTALQADPRAKIAKTPVGAAKGIALSVSAGILMSTFAPSVDIVRSGDNGIGPYGLALLFAGGLFVSTFVYGPFFINFPVRGEPIPLTKYLTGTKTEHLLGFAAGAIWLAGTLASLTAGAAPGATQVPPAVSSAMFPAAALVSALWGLLVWREFRGADFRTAMLVVMGLVLFLAGLAMVSLAPVTAK